MLTFLYLRIHLPHHAVNWDRFTLTIQFQFHTPHVSVRAFECLLHPSRYMHSTRSESRDRLGRERGSRQLHFTAQDQAHCPVSVGNLQYFLQGRLLGNLRIHINDPSHVCHKNTHLLPHIFQAYRTSMGISRSHPYIQTHER